MGAIFGESLIQSVLQSINIVEVIGRYVALKPQGKEHAGLCPFHDDHRPSFMVNPRKGIYKCFACGAGGTVITFMMRREQMTFPEALRHLAAEGGVVLPEASGRTDRASRTGLVEANRWAAQFFRSTFEGERSGLQARRYVQERGITDETARRFGLGWVPDQWSTLLDSARRAAMPIDTLVKAGLVIEKEAGKIYDRFRGRLMFPVMDVMGRVIAFGGRTLCDDQAKYMNSPESELFNKSESLYGLDKAKDTIVKTGRAIVVEGYFDCIMAHQNGLNNVVALLGTSLTDEHGRRLGRYANEIVLVFDPDEAGQKAVDRAIEIFFRHQIEVRLATLPKGMDPCDFISQKEGGEKFLKLIEGASGALDYKWQRLQEEVGSSDTIAGRRKAVEAFLEILARTVGWRSVDEITRGFLLNHVSKLLQMPIEKVHAHMNRLLNRRVFRQRQEEQPSKRAEAVFLDSYQKSQQEILEVLLNRPDLFDQVEGEFELEEISDLGLKAIGQCIWSYCKKGGSGSVGEILATLEEVELCEWATSLASRGSVRGNFENTLAGALDCLRRRREKQKHEEIGSSLSEAASEYGSDIETSLLQELHSKYQPDLRRPGGG